jgi:hypothetical protein
MGYELDPRKTIRRPYKVEYLHRGRRVFRRFTSFYKANGFHRGLPLGAGPVIRYEVKDGILQQD